MKKPLIILLCLAVPYLAIAQEAMRTAKQKEIGVVFYGLDDFGLTFRIGSERSLWRFNTLLLSGSALELTDNESVSTQSSIGFEIKAGKEYRKDIAANLALRLGGDLSFGYSRSKFHYDDKTIDENDTLNEQETYVPGINLVIGLNYGLNNNILVGAEVLPGFSYVTQTTYSTTNGNESKSDISGFSYGFSNTWVLLSLAYRF